MVGYSITPLNSAEAGRDPMSCSMTLHQGECGLTWGFEP